MSLGSFLSGVVGAVVGFAIGGPSGALYGFQVGMLAGSVVFPDKIPAQYGPRLEDAQTTTASVGDPIPRVWGTATVGGTVIFLGTLTETETKKKIGSWPAKQTIYEYKYDQTIAIGLCEGPIAGIRRVWENGVLMYDIRAQFDAETDVDYSARLAQSDKYAATFTLYTGSETQDPDPTLEGEAGAAGVPGYRGLAYVVYPRRLLTDAQGRRHPTFKFEVVSTGVLECTTQTEYANEYMADWLGDTELDPRPPNTTITYRALDYPDEPSGYSSTVYTTLEAARDATQLNGVTVTPQPQIYGWCVGPGGYGALLGLYPDAPPTGSYSPTYDADATYDRIRFFVYSLDEAPEGYSNVAWDSSGSFDDFCYANNLAGKFWTGRMAEPYSNNEAGVIVANGTLPASVHNILRCVLTAAVRVPGAPPDVSDLYPASPIAGYYLKEDGTYVKQTPWVYTAGTYRVMWNTAQGTGGFKYVRVPRDPVLPSTDANYSDSSWWTDQYDALVAEGSMPAGLSYNTSGGFGVAQNFAYVRELTTCTLTSGQASLADIVRDLCAEGGLTAVDVSDLEDIYVKGFVRGQVMTPRSAIEALRPVGLFDCVETSFELKFPTRGKASVRTLATTDLAAYAEGEQIPSGVETRKIQDTELPRTLRVLYTAISRDYESGEQRSPSHVNSDAVNEPTLTIPAVLTDSQAAQAAEIAWAEAWASRWVHNFSLDASHLDLEVGDAVTIPVDGRSTRVRITAIDDRIVGVRQIESVRDDLAAYVSTAEGSASEVSPGGTLAILGTPYLELLDLPYLGKADPRASSSNADLLALVRQDGGNAWFGSMVGTGTTEADYDVQSTIYSAPIFGEVVTEAGSGPTTIIDYGETITVDLAKPTATLSSITEAELLSGANLAAVGADGRWEIVQFLTATQDDTDPNRWTLSGLARGRRGTEWAVGTGEAGDRFVMLTPKGSLGLLPLTTDLIGQSRTYTTLNIESNREAAVEDGTTLTFTARGVLLKPLSPVDVRGTVDDDDDWTITWSRRDRVAQELADSGLFALSEASESYEIEILDGTDVVRTLTATSPTVVYVASSQTADFGAPQTTLTVRIYQLSAVVGRGYAATETLTA